MEFDTETFSRDQSHASLSTTVLPLEEPSYSILNYTDNKELTCSMVDMKRLESQLCQIEPHKLKAGQVLLMWENSKVRRAKWTAINVISLFLESQKKRKEKKRQLKKKSETLTQHYGNPFRPRVI
jgi:hypothetical protein